MVQLTRVVKLPCLSDAETAASNDYDLLDIHEIFPRFNHTALQVSLGAGSLLHGGISLC